MPDVLDECVCDECHSRSNTVDNLDQVLMNDINDVNDSAMLEGKQMSTLILGESQWRVDCRAAKDKHSGC